MSAHPKPKKTRLAHLTEEDLRALLTTASYTRATDFKLVDLASELITEIVALRHAGGQND